MATLASLIVRMGMDSSAMVAGSVRASGSLSRLGAIAKTAGALIGTATVVAGAAAAKMALDYDDAFTKISAISNASAKDIEKWRDQVLEMAGDTAQAPRELADALYFLSSAGLKASQIMPALEASAKGSAIGLGETADVANIVASALNAYASSGLKAAKVTDILVAAVREGRAEPQEFATAMGRILPIASAAGIGFDSVAASLASLSNIGLDVNEGVTAMRGLFQALVSPTAAANEAMASIGLSSQDLLDSLQQDGLIATIRLLDTAARENTTTQADYLGILRELVPNVRSLTGFLGLTTQEAERVDSVFNRVKDSTGSLNEAFATTAESAGFKFRQALAELAAVAIRLGDLILPVLAAIVSFLVNNVGPAWDATVNWLQKVWEKVGPLASILGGALLEAATQIWHVFEANWLPSLKRLYESLQPLIKAVAILAGAILYVALEVLPVLFKWWGIQLEAFSRGVEVVSNVVGAIVRFFQRLFDWFQEHMGGIKEAFLDVWQVIAAAMGPIVGRIVAAIQRIISIIQTLVGWAKTALEALTSVGDWTGGTSAATSTNARGSVSFHAPELQHGGIVEATGLAVVHAGETVIPAGSGAGNITINVGGSVVTERELIDVIRDGLIKAGRSGQGHH